MKEKIRLSILLLAALSVTIVSCKKDFEQDSLVDNAGNAVSAPQNNPSVSEGSVCGAVMYKDSAGKARMDEMEQRVQTYIAQTLANRTASSASTQSVVTVPVVFHVMYNLAEQNISDAQLKSQIDALNKDFTATNTDISSVPAAFQNLIGNPGIQFVLAKRDPAGKATTGIIRKQTTVPSFSSDGQVCSSTTGGDDAWPATQYLNIWVCNKTGAGGFAAYPWSGSPSTDGVIIGYNYVGTTGTFTNNWSYQLGRTVTHEVGHWFGLAHTWGDFVCGDDLVNDTPPQSGANGSCPTFPHVSSCSPNSDGDMFMNYMDYSNDACRNMFSAGQATRMLGYLNTTRAGLLTSLGGVAPDSGATCDIPDGLNTGTVTSSSAILGWTSTGAASYNLRYKPTSSSTWSTETSVSTSISISGLNPSTSYEFQVQSECSSSSSSFSSSSNFTTLANLPPCDVPTSLSASSITSNSATLNWAATGGSTYNVMYKSTTASSWTTVSASTNSLAVSGLSSSASYEFKVQNVCSGNSSSYSSAFSFTTAVYIPPCTTPASLSATSIKTDGATLNWSSTGATGYNVKYKSTTASSWTTASQSTNSLVISGLSGSTTYEFQVQGACSGNTSSYSSSFNFTTLANLPSCPTPTSLTVTSIKANGATLNWPSTGALSYKVMYKSTTASSWTTVSASTNSIAIAGLSASTMYEFKVQSTCTGGNTSSYSSASTFSTLAKIKGGKSASNR